MSESRPPLELRLDTVAEATELSSSLAKVLGLAASVSLERYHGSGEVVGVISRGSTSQPSVLMPSPVTETDRQSFDDPDEAAELGASGVGCLVARRVLRHVVFRRLPVRSGADYLMRSKAGGDADRYSRLRLECSGIGRGHESTAARLAAKVRQLAAGRHADSGVAIVTHFRAQPVEIGIASWPP